MQSDMTGGPCLDLQLQALHKQRPKQFKAGLETANFSETTNWELENRPFGFEAVPVPRGGDFELLHAA